MKILLIIYLHLFVQSQDVYWEDYNNFYLSTGSNLTCSNKIYQAISVGTKNQMIFDLPQNIGYSQIVYTLHLYYVSQATLFNFQENGQNIAEKRSFLQQQQQQQLFFCNSNYFVEDIRIESQFNDNVNLIQFQIITNTLDSFMVSQLKIFVKRCHKWCLKCQDQDLCIQCHPNFSLSNHKCLCQSTTPYEYQDRCLSQCPVGFYENDNKCLPYFQKNLIFQDDQASQFNHIKDFNTSTRNMIFQENGNTFVGFFIQNEAIQYTLPEPIYVQNNFLLTFSIWIVNIQSQIQLSIKLDDYVYQQSLLFFQNQQQTQFYGNFQSCTIKGNPKCIKYTSNLFISSLTSLNNITIQLNLPLNNSNTGWALGNLKLEEIILPQQSVCLQFQYKDECIDRCPAITQQIGQKCQSIMDQYPFAKIIYQNFTEGQIYYNKQIQIYQFFQFYQYQYIFGGYQKWNNQPFIQEILVNPPHYKAKIYIKLILIDPQNNQDSITLSIEDNEFTFSKNNADAYCINNSGTGGCTQQEDLGTIANDYIINFQYEIVHWKNYLKFKTKCNANSIGFYCAYYDFIVLLAICPLNCLQCDSSTNCLKSIMMENHLANFKQIFYSCPLNGYYMHEGQCLACRSFCEKCSNLEKCEQCKVGYVQYGEMCICQYNNINALYTDCNEECEGSCSTCQIKNQYVSTCSNCDINEKKVKNVNECICIDGYYMDKSTFQYQCKACNQTCKTCSEGQICLSCYTEQNREFNDSKCICKSGYYEFDQSDLNCFSCNSNCKTCLNSIDYCTSCFTDQFRILSLLNTCDCQIGYYEDKNKICQKCDIKCESCLNFQYCLSCDINQFRQYINKTKLCECIEGYYENENNQCEQCYYTCSKCNNSNQPNQCIQCPSTRVQYQKIKNIFQCKCKIGYYDIGDLQCYSCLDYLYPPIDHYCYSKCGDSIVQWNEECDDGNQDSRDGCNQCYYSNAINQNSNCLNLQSNICQQCNDGYYLNQENKCQQCQEHCINCKDQSINCIECKYKNEETQNCIKCNKDQGYQDIDGKCYSICGDGIKTKEEQCDDGNTIKNDGCDEFCFIEQGYDCLSICKEISQIKMSLQEDKNDSNFESLRLINLTFNQLIKLEGSQQLKSIVTLKPIKEGLKINSIVVIDFTDYMAEFITPKLMISFEIIESFQKPEVQVEITKTTQIINQEGTLMNSFEEQIIVKDYYQQSKITQRQVQNIESTSNYVIYLISGLAISSIILGGINYFINILDCFQYINYLRYINIQYPYNLQKYLSIFKYTDLHFIKEQLRLFQFNQEIQGILPFKFSKEEYSILFFNNIIFEVLILFTILIIFILIQLIMYYIKTRILKQKLQRVRSTFVDKQSLTMKRCFYDIFKCLFQFVFYFQSILYQTYRICQFDLNIAVFLQLWLISLDNKFLILNFLFWLSSIIIHFYFLFFKVFRFCDIQKRDQTNTVNVLYHKLIIIKKILYVFCIIYLYDCPYYQIASITCLNLFYSIFIVRFNIFQSKCIKYQLVSVELIFSLTQILIQLFGITNIFQFNIQDQSETIGWIIIILFNIILIIQIGFNLYKYLKYIKERYQIIQKLKKIFQRFLYEPTENDSSLSKIGEDLFLKQNKKENISQFIKANEQTNQNKRMIPFSLGSNIV